MQQRSPETDVAHGGRARIDELREQRRRVVERDLDASLSDGYGKQLALSTVAGQRKALEIAYGRSPHAKSHGETFLAILRQRLKPKGLYFLDEPAAQSWPKFVEYGKALAATGLGRVVFASPWLPTSPGTDKYTDQLW